MRRFPWPCLCTLIAALCACAHTPAKPPPAPPIAAAPPAAVPAAPPAAAVSPLPGAAVARPAASTALPAPASIATPPAPVALILPSQATPFARAAEAVQLGFFAAHRVAPARVTIEVIEIEDNLAQLGNALATAAKRGAKLAVGPLTRALANALGGGRVLAPLPVLTLNVPESDAAVAPESLAFGLAIEAEARHAVALALAELPPAATTAPRFLLLAGESALARRMAAAFHDALRERGERATQLDVRVGYAVLQTLSQQLPQLKIDAVLAALDAREAAFIRPRLPPALPVYATSQVNVGGAEAALLAPDLEGVRFVDMPWLLQPDHPAVMVYPRPQVALSGELQRLYALGIDAYRLMTEWLAGRREFEIDGVTGRLRVDRSRSARVERRPLAAVFRSGRIERLESAR